MAVKNLEFPLFRYLVPVNGQLTPAVGYKVYTYKAGTSDPLTTYSDAALTTPNTNPVILGADGSASIFYTEAAKIDLKTDEDAAVTGFPVDNINPTLDSVVSGDYNLVTNGDFEELESGSSTDPASWVLSPETSATISVDNAINISGTNSLKFDGGGSGGGSATSSFFNVSGGTSLVLDFQYYSSNAGTTNTIVINWFDAASAPAGSTTAFTDGGTAATSWEYNSVEVAVPAAARKAKVVITGVSSGGSNLTEDTWFDSIQISFYQGVVQEIIGNLTATATELNNNDGMRAGVTLSDDNYVDVFWSIAGIASGATSETVIAVTGGFDRITGISVKGNDATLSYSRSVGANACDFQGFQVSAVGSGITASLTGANPASGSIRIAARNASPVTQDLSGYVRVWRA